MTALENAPSETRLDANGRCPPCPRSIWAHRIAVSQLVRMQSHRGVSGWSDCQRWSRRSGRKRTSPARRGSTTCTASSSVASRAASSKANRSGNLMERPDDGRASRHPRPAAVLCGQNRPEPRCADLVEAGPKPSFGARARLIQELPFDYYLRCPGRGKSYRCGRRRTRRSRGPDIRFLPRRECRFH
jgi:hypothetical protein